MRNRAIHPFDVLTATMRVTGVCYDEVAGKGRHPTVTATRRVYSVVAKQHTRYSSTEIAATMGKTNHSTVFTAINRFEDCVAQNIPAFRDRAGREWSYEELERVVEEMIGVRDPKAVPA